MTRAARPRSTLRFRGDIRYLGALGAGPLPLDRRHSWKVYGNYLTDVGVNFGIGFNALSGTPLTPFAANPLYDSDGEIPEAPRGAGIETVDGFRQRTPWMTGLDLPADYALRVGGERRVLLLADVFQPVQPALAPRLRQLHGGGVWSLEPRLRARHPVSGPDRRPCRRSLRFLREERGLRSSGTHVGASISCWKIAAPITSSRRDTRLYRFSLLHDFSQRFCASRATPK